MYQINLPSVADQMNQGVIQISSCRLTSIGIPMLKIRRSHDRLIFNMGIPIPGKDGLYIETGPGTHLSIFLNPHTCSF